MPARPTKKAPAVVVNIGDDQAATVSQRDELGRLLVGAGIPGYPDWWVLAHVDDQADPAVIVRISVEPRADGDPNRRGITADVLRAVRFGPLIDDVNQHLAGHQAKTRLPGPAQARARSDEYYARVAANYSDLVNQQQAKSPNVILAEQLGLRTSQVRDLILACRNRELLTKAPAGRPGGHLTDKARAILEAASGPATRKTRRH